MMEKKVSIIEPIRMKHTIKTAAYARVSSKSDDQIHSFGSQVAYYTEYIGQLKNHILVDVYTDEGITGTVIEKRTGFKEMINDCKKGKIDRIITKSIDRFGRNFTETLKTLRELKCLGVSVYFEKENIDTQKSNSEISISSYMMASEWESRNISNNQRWGFRTRAEQGIYNQPHLPYGYYREGDEIKINEDEAFIVKLMFDMYVEKDMSTVAIEKYFNKNRIGNRKWSRSGIVLMLINERYCGDQLLQKKFTTDEFPYHLVQNKGELPQYYVYDSFPAIIGRTLYEASYDKWEKSRSELSEEQLSANQRYTYTSKIECCSCHKKFKRRVYRGEKFWCCTNHLKDRGICMNKQITEKELNEAFLRMYHKLHNSLDKLEAYGDNLAEFLMSDEKLNELTNLDKELTALHHEKVKILQANIEGYMTDIEKITKLNEIHMYKSLYELEKKKLLNETYECDSVLNNKRLLYIIQNCGHIQEFDEHIFQTIIKAIMVNQDFINFKLYNGLDIKVERRMYDGNYC